MIIRDRDYTPPEPANSNRRLKLQPGYTLPADPERLLTFWQIGIAIAAAERGGPNPYKGVDAADAVYAAVRDSMIPRTRRRYPNPIDSSLSLPPALPDIP